MTNQRFSMDDYVPVNERLDAFYAKYPEGSIQSEIVELTESRVTVKAYAYRAAEDARPGIGHSSLGIPGATPYTKGSEIENCETSAWGRAIAALGFEVKRGVASREEVANKQPSGPERPAVRPEAGVVPPPPAPVETEDRQRRQLKGDLLEAGRVHGWSDERIKRLADEFGVPKGTDATIAQLREMVKRIDDSPMPADETDLEPSPFDGEWVAAATGGELLPENPAAGAIAKAKARAAAQKVTA